VMSLFHKNMLAASFLVPLFLALGDSMHNPARAWRVAARASTLLIAAGLWYAVSRGAIVGALAGIAAYVGLSPRGWRFAAAGLALIAMLVVVRPDFGASSGIMERFTDIGHGAESENLAWRMHERWPHFVDIVANHPLFGVGQAADYSLGADTNTPHNGYLALMVQSGIPATVCYVLILVMIAVRALSLTRERLPDRVRGWAAVSLAGLVAFCVHNFVDSTFESGVAAYSIWVLCGIVMGLHVRHHRSRDRSPAHGTRPGVRGPVKRRAIVAA
jgi:O-antigen ligase